MDGERGSAESLEDMNEEQPPADFGCVPENPSGVGDDPVEEADHDGKEAFVFFVEAFMHHEERVAGAVMLDEKREG